MSGWKTLKIKDLGRVVTGKTPPTAVKEFFDGEELFVSPKDLDWDQYYVFLTETRVSEKALEKLKNQVLPANSVMFTCISFAFGKMGITSQPSLTNQQINAVVVNEKHDFRFVYYLLKAYRPTIFSYNSGIDTPIVPKSVFEGIEVACPAKPTQQKIAAILSAYDDLVSNNQRRITLLEHTAEDIYREWFLRLRFPGHQQVKIKRGVPHGWCPSTLGAIADFTMGQSPSSEYFNDVNNGLPFHQGVGSYGPRYPTHDTFCSVFGRKARLGDILFSVRAPVGRLNIADREVLIGRGLAAIRHKRGMNGYLLYLLKVTFASEDIIGNGSIFNSVGKDELARLCVFEPDFALVEKFERLVQSIDKQIAALYKANTSLKATRDTLLPRLISGKLAVDALDIRFPPGMAVPTA